MIFRRRRRRRCRCGCSRVVLPAPAWDAHVAALQRKPALRHPSKEKPAAWTTSSPSPRGGRHGPGERQRTTRCSRRRASAMRERRTPSRTATTRCSSIARPARPTPATVKAKTACAVSQAVLSRPFRRSLATPDTDESGDWPRSPEKPPLRTTNRVARSKPSSPPRR